MIDGYGVDPKDLDHDAKVFARWSESLAVIGKGVPRSMVSEDFSFLPGAQEIYTEFVMAASVIAQYIDQGAKIFRGFEHRLLKTEEIYLTAEADSQADIERINKELELP